MSDRQLKNLPLAEKLEIIRMLTLEVDQADILEVMNARQEYHLATPVFEPGASEALIAELQAAA
jgi:hypothetical protein